MLLLIFPTPKLQREATVVWFFVGFVVVFLKRIWKACFKKLFILYMITTMRKGGCMFHKVVGIA